jgi:hypothetical protein
MRIGCTPCVIKRHLMMLTEALGCMLLGVSMVSGGTFTCIPSILLAGVISQDVGFVLAVGMDSVCNFVRLSSSDARITLVAAEACVPIGTIISCKNGTSVTSIRITPKRQNRIGGLATGGRVASTGEGWRVSVRTCRRRLGYASDFNLDAPSWIGARGIHPFHVAGIIIAIGIKH